MKTALFGFFPNTSPGRYGGVEQSGRLAWQALENALQLRGERATLFCYEQDASRGSGFVEDPDQITAYSKTQAIWQVLRVKIEPRLILVWHLGLLKLVPLLRAGNARLAVFVHGVEAWRAQDALTRRVLKRVDLFLANSNFSYNRFLDYVPEARRTPYCVTPLGIGTPLLNVITPSASPCVLMLSRLDRAEDYKGHRELIEVWTRVRAQIPDAQLWIAGDGDLREELEAMVRARGLEQAVCFWGRVDETQKQELLQACRALAMPSRREGFGLVYLEALRAGRPCLVSTVDAGIEVVNPPEAGLAANPDDPHSLAEAVCRLLQPGEEWTRWSHRAQGRYESNFTAAHFQRRLMAALEPLL